MKRIPLYAFLIICIISACTKQKRVFNYFSKGNGGWKTVSYSYQTFNEDGQLVEDETYENTGEMKFYENGRMYWKIPFETDFHTISGVWTNSEDELIITVAGNDSELFKISEKTRNTLTLRNEHHYTFGDEIVTVKLNRD